MRGFIGHSVECQFAKVPFPARADIYPVTVIFVRVMVSPSPRMRGFIVREDFKVIEHGPIPAHAGIYHAEILE